MYLLFKTKPNTLCLYSNLKIYIIINTVFILALDSNMLLFLWVELV